MRPTTSKPYNTKWLCYEIISNISLVNNMTTARALIAFCWFFTVFSVVVRGASIHSNEATLFDRLDNYSLLDIFDWLDLADLANLSTLGERYKHLILNHYGLDLNGASVDTYVSKTDEHVAFYSAPFGKLSSDHRSSGLINLFAILRAFCSSFGHLQMMSEIVNDDLLQRLADIVNTHCSNVPQNMIITLPYRRIPNVTFENVTNVEILKAHNVVTLIQLDHLFPRMTHLRIDGMIRVGHLPQLEHLEYVGPYGGFADFTKIATQMQQISSLKLNVQWPKFGQIQQINRHFADLETLDLGLLRYSDQLLNGIERPVTKSIHFRKVKHFRLDVTGFDEFLEQFQVVGPNIALIEFDHLESYTFAKAKTPLNSEMIDLIVRNRELTRLSLETLVSYEQLQRFIDELPKLEELTLDCRFGDQLDVVRQIMTEANNLKRVSILFSKKEERPEYQGIIERGQSPDGWSKTDDTFVFIENYARSVTYNRS